MKKVSVIIPSYNSVQFLPQTVKSVLAQTFNDFDVMIINDGSTDGTKVWLSQLTDPRLRFVEQENQGLPSARNTGIAATASKYVALLDADDLWEPTKLERQVAVLDANPEVGMVHTAIDYLDEHGTKQNRVLGVQGHGDVWQELVVNRGVRCGSTPMIRRSCFDVVGVFDPTLSFGEDWDMWLRIAARFHISTINEPLVLYRQHATNMTKSYQKIMPNFLKILERAFREVPQGSETLKNKAYANAYLFAAWRAFFAGDVYEARSLHRQAYQHYPKLRLAKNSLNLSFQLARAQWAGLQLRHRG